MESPVFLDEFSQAKVETPWFAVVAGARKVTADPQLYALKPRVVDFCHQCLRADSSWSDGACLRAVSDLSDLASEKDSSAF